MSQLAAPITEDTQPAGEVPGWLVLFIDKLRLAIPQKDAKAIELASTLDVAVEDEAEAGWLEQDGNLWPVYCVDNHLVLRVEAPHSRRFCVMLYASDKFIGLLCDEVRILPSDDDLDLGEMPECLADPESPLKWITLLDGKIVAAVESGALARHMTELEARYGAD